MKRHVNDMTELERLIALEAIYDLKSRRDHAVDRKDWDTYAELHSDNYIAESVADRPVVGGREVADLLKVHMANVSTAHHSHTPVIEFQDRDHATGVWAMEDNLFWTKNGERQWLRGFGFYHERYVRRDGRWLFCYRRLERTHVLDLPRRSPSVAMPLPPAAQPHPAAKPAAVVQLGGRDDRVEPGEHADARPPAQPAPASATARCAATMRRAPAPAPPSRKLLGSR